MRTIDRKLLQQALQQGKDISASAISGQGFDPRGGVGVLAAQLATAGIGKFAQNRAQKQLAEQDLQTRTNIEGRFPELAGLNLSAETLQAEGLRRANITSAAPKRVIRETAGGLVSINPATGRSIPVTAEGGRQLQPSVKERTVVNVGGEEPAFRKSIEQTRGSKVGARIDKIETDADAAVGVLANLDVIEGNLSNVQTTGPLDSAKIFMNNLGTQLGLQLDLSETSSLEQINAASKQLSVPLVKQLGVNPTDRDAKIIEATVAGLGKSKDANKNLIHVLRQVSNKRLVHAKISDQLRDEGREREIARTIREYDKSNPTTQLKKSSAVPLTPSGTIDVSKLKKGSRYQKDGLVVIFDGIGFVEE